MRNFTKRRRLEDLSLNCQYYTMNWNSIVHKSIWVSILRQALIYGDKRMEKSLNKN